jgi:eukaryotic-like serine/threonine-protein kinase
VTGVSWYEAAAYAEFSGKTLPTVYDWVAAAGPDAAEYVIPLSNFGGQRLYPVGWHKGIAFSGAFDMAGNAKEWCFNEAKNGARYILGGGWNEPPYMFNSVDAQSPFDRSDVNGFRCVR